MSFHLIAFQSSVLTSASVGVALGAVADGYAFGSSTDGFMLPKDMELIAAYACSEFLDQAWIVAPSLRRVGYPYITPVQQNPAGYSTPYDPNLMELIRNPIMLKKGERLAALARLTAAGGTDSGVVLLWLRAKPQPVPHGEAFWIPYTCDTSPATVANNWTSVPLTFDQTLPSGTYLVVGLDHYTERGIAARVSCPGSFYRPGALVKGEVTGASAGRNHELFYSDDLGVYGAFDTDAPPAIEVLATSAGITAHTGYMRLIRVGDLGLAARYQCQ